MAKAPHEINNRLNLRDQIKEHPLLPLLPKRKPSLLHEPVEVFNTLIENSEKPSFEPPRNEMGFHLLDSLITELLQKENRK